MPVTGDAHAFVWTSSGGMLPGSHRLSVGLNANGTTDTIPPTPVAQMTASAIFFDSWTPAGHHIGVANYRIVATHFGLPGQANHVTTLPMPVTNFSLSARAAAGTLALDWSGSTHLDITPEPGVPMKFYRVIATAI